MSVVILTGDRHEPYAICQTSTAHGQLLTSALQIFLGVQPVGEHQKVSGYALFRLSNDPGYFSALHLLRYKPLARSVQVRLDSGAS